jgi:hypothetical protein
LAAIADAFGEAIAGLPKNEPTNSTEATSINTVAITHGPVAMPSHSGAAGRKGNQRIDDLEPVPAKSRSQRRAERMRQREMRADKGG